MSIPADTRDQVTEGADRQEPRRKDPQGRAALDPALADQFDRGPILVRPEGNSSATPHADALQRPTYGPPTEAHSEPPTEHAADERT